MRTTLTLDDDLAVEIKALASATGRSFKQAVNETLRTGLAVRKRKPKARRYRLMTRDLGGLRGGGDLVKALRLAEAIEDSETLREIEARK